MSEELENKEEIEIEHAKLKKQALTIIDELEAHLKDGRREIHFATRTLEKNAILFDDKVKEQLVQFEQKILQLAEENFALRKLPEKLEDKLGESLNQLVPVISNHLQKKIFEDFNLAMTDINKSVFQLNEKISIATKKIAEMNSKALKKKLMSFALVLSIMMLASAGITYLMMQYFPQKIMIDTKGDINIDGGNVSIWGTGKNDVQRKKGR